MEVHGYIELGRFGRMVANTVFGLLRLAFCVLLMGVGFFAGMKYVDYRGLEGRDCADVVQIGAKLVGRSLIPTVDQVATFLVESYPPVLQRALGGMCSQVVWYSMFRDAKFHEALATLLSSCAHAEQLDADVGKNFFTAMQDVIQHLVDDGTLEKTLNGPVYHDAVLALLREHEEGRVSKDERVCEDRLLALLADAERKLPKGEIVASAPWLPLYS